MEKIDVSWKRQDLVCDEGLSEIAEGWPYIKSMIRVMEKLGVSVEDEKEIIYLFIHLYFFDIKQ